MVRCYAEMQPPASLKQLFGRDLLDRAVTISAFCVEAVDTHLRPIPAHRDHRLPKIVAYNDVGARSRQARIDEP